MTLPGNSRGNFGYGYCRHRVAVVLDSSPHHHPSNGREARKSSKRCQGSREIVDFPVKHRLLET
eukprot:5776358-Heterocapsa_arctica.AAC.1